MYTFDQERLSDNADINSLLDTVFGPDRENKASYTLRNAVEPIHELCTVVRCEKGIAATIRYWPVSVRDLIANTQETALLLGPVAVSPDAQGEGVGSSLIEYTLERAWQMGHERILLVGESCYYARFGFLPVLPSFITLPGGRDARRLLVKQSARLASLPAVGKLEPWAEAPESLTMQPQKSLQPAFAM